MTMRLDGLNLGDLASFLFPSSPTFTMRNEPMGSLWPNQASPSMHVAWWNMLDSLVHWWSVPWCTIGVVGFLVRDRRPPRGGRDASMGMVKGCGGGVGMVKGCGPKPFLYHVFRTFEKEPDSTFLSRRHVFVSASRSLLNVFVPVRARSYRYSCRYDYEPTRPRMYTYTCEGVV